MANLFSCLFLFFFFTKSKVFTFSVLFNGIVIAFCDCSVKLVEQGHDVAPTNHYVLKMCLKKQQNNGLSQQVNVLL